MAIAEPLDKMALADKPDYLSSWSDPENPRQKMFDYTHLLPQDLIDSGYKMHVGEFNYRIDPLSPHEYTNIGLNAHVTHPSSKRPSGVVGGYTYEKKLNVEKRGNVAFTHALEVEKGHRGLNLGKYALLALLTHGFKYGGIDTVQTHEGHTMNAEKAHRWLIAQENLGEGQDIPPTQIRGNDPDSIRGYRYTLKNEQPMSKSEGRGSNMLKDGRYAVYNLKPSKEGMEKHLSAVFAFKDGNFHLLEDHGNVFAQVHGEDGKKPSELLKHKLHSLMTNSSYVKVVPTKEDNIHSQEKRHVAEVELPDPHTGRQIFSYKHASHSGASPLVFEKGSFHLNGYPLSMDELHHLRKEVESGNATVTYPDDMFKAEEGFFEDLSKATLYHGTIVDHEPSIRQIGVIPSTGEFIQDAYGDELEAPAEQDEMSFWADKHTFDRATTAMISHVARKLGKGFHDVNKDDIRNHGLLVISKGHEPQSHKRYSGWGMGRAPAKGNEYYNWEKPNPYIEPEDIFTTDNVHADIMLKGSKLVSFLERMHGQKKGTQHPSKLGKAESLEKMAVLPKDLRILVRGTDLPSGEATVDHTGHLSNIPDAVRPSVDLYESGIKADPKSSKISAKDFGGGISRKSVFKVGGSRTKPSKTIPSIAPQDEKFMLKPYHEKIDRRLRGWAQAHMQGWAEMANQALYHAGGIGDLHQKVFVAEHEMEDGKKVPFLAVHVGKGFSTIRNLSYINNYITDKIHTNPKTQDDIKKIALMDFLTNNLDRHGENLLVNKQTGELLAIDHSRSFQYINDRKDKSSKKNIPINDSLGTYIGKGRCPFTGYSVHKTLYHHPNKFDFADSFKPTIEEWWKNNSGNIRKEMDNQLKHIKDRKLRNHIKVNFEARADQLDDFAKHGIDNFGADFYETPVELIRPWEHP